MADNDNFLCTKKSCSNRSKYVHNDLYLCGVHIPKKDRSNVMLIEEKIAKSIKPTKTIDKMELYERRLCNLLFYPEFLSGKESRLLYDKLEELYPPEMKGKTRRALVFGNANISYDVQYGGGYISDSKRLTRDWSEFPIMEAIKRKVDILTRFLFPDRKYEYTVCLIQRYPTGNALIRSHKDREIGKDQLIMGVSVGAERILGLLPPARVKTDNIYIKLTQGSLYAFLPPTNDHWRHTILQDHTQSPRYSLTFRTYNKH